MYLYSFRELKHYRKKLMNIVNTEMHVLPEKHISSFFSFQNFPSSSVHSSHLPYFLFFSQKDHDGRRKKSKNFLFCLFHSLAQKLGLTIIIYHHRSFKEKRQEKKIMYEEPVKKVKSRFMRHNKCKQRHNNKCKHGASKQKLFCTGYCLYWKFGIFF